MTKSARIIDALKTDTAYSFHVRAKNIIGKWSELSNVVIKTTIKDTTAPSTPTGAGLSTPFANYFMLKWIAGTEKDLEAYYIYVYTNNTPALAKIIKRVGYATNSVIVNEADKTEDSSITINVLTTYYFWVTAVDESGNESGKLALGSGQLPLEVGSHSESLSISASISPSESPSKSLSLSLSKSSSLSPSASISLSLSSSDSPSASVSPSESSSPSPSI